jgi:hypothetical protein
MVALNQTLAKIIALNTAEQPFIYEVSENKITGKWDITNSRWFAPGSVTDVIEKYLITITLDKVSGTFSIKETKAASVFRVGLSPDGSINIGGESSMFSGSMNQKSFEIGVGGEKNEPNSVGVNTINFDTKHIKEPLLSLLLSLGWKKKRLFFGLFS